MIEMQITIPASWNTINLINVNAINYFAPEDHLKEAAPHLNF